MTPVAIGDRLIGAGEPCFIVAEIGINHNGDIDLAKAMVEAAAQAGADSVKFQNYRTEDFISDRSLVYGYVSQGKTVVESQYEMFKRCEVTPHDLKELKRHCDRCGVIFHSTPTSEAGIGALVDVGALVLKNGSDYLVNLPLIRTMAATRLTTVLSTGMATLSEIGDAVRTFREAGGSELILLHCTSAYPTPAAEVHLRKIPTLAARFCCPVGFSDHTRGIASAIGAVVLGACWVEKHFTLDKGLPGPDQGFSADPVEFAALVDAVRTVEQNLGSAEIGPTSLEMEGRANFRLSCTAANDLPSGHILEERDIAFRRPGTGYPPSAVGSLIGLRLGRPLRAGQLLESGDFP